MADMFYNQTLNSIVPCHHLTAIGVGYVILAVCSAVANALVVYTILRNKKLHTPINYLITLLSAVNLMGSVSQLPAISASAFNCGFMYEEFTCKLQAIAFCFTITGNLYILMTISIERYLVICKPFKNYTFNTKRSFIYSISQTMLISLLWSVSPYTQWSAYAFDEAKISCIVRGVGPSRIYLSVALALFLYVIPLGALLFTNVATILKVRKSSRRFANDGVNKIRVGREAQLVRVTIALLASFIISSTPQLASSFAKSVSTDVYYLGTTVTLLINRSLVLWPALINMFMNKDIKHHLLKSIRISPIATSVI